MAYQLNKPMMPCSLMLLLIDHFASFCCVSISAVMICMKQLWQLLVIFWSYSLFVSIRSQICCHELYNYHLLIFIYRLGTQGGYDKRLKVTVDYLEELRRLVVIEGVSDHVTFVTLCSTSERDELPSNCLCVLEIPKI